MNKLLQNILKKLSCKPCPRCENEFWLNVCCEEEAMYSLSFYPDTHFHPPHTVEERLNRFTNRYTDKRYYCGFCDLVIYDVETKKWATDEDVAEEVEVEIHEW